MSGKICFRRFSFLVVFFSVFVFSQLYALSGEPQKEFDEFIRNIREENRIDRIGYLILISLSPEKSNDDRVLSLAGKYFYSSEEGYLAHVDYTRLQDFINAGIQIKVIDKKRLDNNREAWYMLWVENEALERNIKLRFEPIYQIEKTTIVRMKVSDEKHLNPQGVKYQIIDEELLPLRTSVSGKPVKIKIPDPEIEKLVPMIKADSLASTVQKLQDFKSRYVKEAGNKAAVEWLVSEFAKIPGLTQATATFSTSSYGNLSNVVFEKTGTREPKTVYVVCGHLDSTVSSYKKADAPGADDNASGMAGVLEIARVLSKKELPFTVIFAGMNAEEIGLVGSKALAKALTNNSGITIKAALNMDMIADVDDNQVALIGNTASNWLIDVVKDAGKLYAGLDSKPFYNSKIWYSDHSSFWNVGVPAILSIEGNPEMSKYYHSAGDKLENMAPSLMEKITRANLAALLTLNPIPQAK
ncbi:MAG: Zn-dependent exopeptidase M28 [Candidatus Riflebacteria bacterium]|nr:Zn-dependent exopeptidase M28 [Candidatus Riflebacteria bacterium]